MHRYPLVVIAISLFFTGCASIPLPTLEPHAVQLIDLSDDLVGYEDEPRYDYLEETVFYSEIGVEDFDDVFFRAAVLAGRLQQLRSALSQYHTGELDLEDEADYAFLSRMADEATVTLPRLRDEARELGVRISKLQPGSLSLSQMMKFGSAVNQARQNLVTVLAIGADEIDAVLDDYEALKGDLDRVAG